MVQVIQVIIELAILQAPEPAVAPPAPQLHINTAFDFLIKRVWAMIPIGLCSLVALTIIVERFMIVRRSRVAPHATVEELHALVDEPARALEWCRTRPSPIANVIADAIRRANEPEDLLEKHVEEAG